MNDGAANSAEPTPVAQAEDGELIAYRPASAPIVDIAPAPRWRDWINAMDERWANRCLPLIVANEAGWVLQNPLGFEAVWDGGTEASNITVTFDRDAPGVEPVQTHFGYGILTWAVPYLFRTPPGWNLLARGPANWPKDGVCALEGLVETDWSVATFTMNWKLTRPGLAVRFDEGEPYCMVVPQRRGELEGLRPSIRALETQPELRDATKAWSNSRHDSQVRKFLAHYSGEFAHERGSWEQDYYRGRTPDGTRAPVHQTQLRLRDFEPE